MKKRRFRRSNLGMTGDMIKMGVSGVVGATMIGATANAAAGLSAGPAKAITQGVTVPMMAAGLAGSMAGYATKSLGSTERKLRFRRNHRRI